MKYSWYKNQGHQWGSLRFQSWAGGTASLVVGIGLGHHDNKTSHLGILTWRPKEGPHSSRMASTMEGKDLLEQRRERRGRRERGEE